MTDVNKLAQVGEIWQRWLPLLEVVPIIRGRANGKTTEFNRRSAELAQYFAPDQIVDYGKVIGYHVRVTSRDVDRTFENEVRIHV